MGRRGNRQSSPELNAEHSRRGIRLFSHESLRLATRDFKTLIGEGGSYKVYWGVLDDDDMPVVVKVLKSNGFIFKNKKGFLEVIEVISHIQHKNLNRIIGCCVDKDARMVVSEYIDNGTLYDLIGDSDRRRSIFSWKTRLALCIGIARGISYLHEDIHPRVVHRDIKPANILLESNLTSKITDFELVGFVYLDQDLPLADVVCGTVGYLDPDYKETGKYTEKADVYAFGVVMLEVVSGRRAYEYRSPICSWAARLVANDRKLEVVDPLLSDFPKDDALRFIDVSFLCTQLQSERRPSMSEVLLMLSGVCHHCSQALRGVHMCTTVDATIIQAHLATSVEDDGENDALFTQKVSTNASVDLNSEVKAQGELDDDSAENEQEQSNETTVSEGAAQQWQMMKPEIMLSGNSDYLAERLSQTQVFTENTKNVFSEAVYPPFRTRVF